MEQLSSLLAIGRYKQQLDLAIFRVVNIRRGSQVIRRMFVGDSWSLAPKVWPDEGNAGTGKLHPKMLSIRHRSGERPRNGQVVEGNRLHAGDGCQTIARSKERPH